MTVLASAFTLVFGAFVVAFVVLCGAVVTWAVRRDRTRWREWRERRDG
jgi:ABC-type Fe3+ transport system permease subunit